MNGKKLISKNAVSAPPIDDPGPSYSPPASAIAATVGGAGAVIEVNVESETGNTVFLRGSGGGLNWNKGVSLTSSDGKTWRWSGMIQTPVIFKVLINDQIWSSGSDYSIKPGETIKVEPHFS